jgi:hypothetical protein
MNVSEFLNDCQKQWPGFEHAKALALYEHPRDRDLASLPSEVQGMSTENKLMLLNLAVRSLEPGEVYVEIGCWRGLSLAGAALHNSNAPIFACDDFSQFSGSLGELDNTLRKYTTPTQVRFYDTDYLSFLDLAPWQPARVGVYFYDGGHSFKQQYQALDRMFPWLADRALVIIDDTNAGQVRSANRLFMSRAPGFQLLNDVRTPGNEHPTWWNGVQIYSYESIDKEYSSQRHKIPYQTLRFFWDEIMPPARNLFQGARRIASAVPGLRPLNRYFRRQLSRRSI